MEHSRALLLLVCALGLLGQGQGAGSGRAFPIDSENYVTEKFQRINSRLQWDHTNFLVDLAGHYANCNSLGQRGKIQVDKVTPEGERITGIVDSTSGPRSDVQAVNEYLQTLVDRWTLSGEHNNLILNAQRFGCSVRPGCSGQVVASCLFSGTALQIIDCTVYPSHPDCQKDQGTGTPKALAFTPQQYNMAEQITGNRWDRSHYLENLSGQETDCVMLDTKSWPFATATREASNAGIRVSGIYGHAENRGSTPNALRTILTNFKLIPHARNVGCSVIPDCTGNDGRMYVVVSCLYEETYYK